MVLRGNFKHLKISNIYLIGFKSTKYGDLDKEDVRLASFNGWIKIRPTPSSLAAAGFFYTKKDDITKCYSCFESASNWLETDDPVLEHKRLFPNCNFSPKNYDVTGCGFARIDTATPKYLTHTRSTSRLQSFSHWPLINSPSINDLVDAGQFATGFIDYTLCYWCGGGLRFWNKEDNVKEVHAKYYPDCGLVKPKKGESVHLDCIKCFIKYRECVLIPCGHLLTCLACTKTLCDCPVCHEKIQSSIETFTT